MILLNNSWFVIKKLVNSYKYTSINLKKIMGNTVNFSWFIFSSGKYIIMMDDDLQHDPSYILNILNELKRFCAYYIKYLKSIQCGKSF